MVNIVSSLSTKSAIIGSGLAVYSIETWNHILLISYAPMGLMMSVTDWPYIYNLKRSYPLTVHHNGPGRYYVM